jgi:hypothetical protein
MKSSMAPTDMDKTSKRSVPQAYRQGLVTAITVFLGFSLSFMRFWSFEKSRRLGLAGHPLREHRRRWNRRAAFRPISLSRSPRRPRGTLQSHSSIFLLGHHDRCGWCYCGGCRSSLTVPNRSGDGPKSVAHERNCSFARPRRIS